MGRPTVRVCSACIRCGRTFSREYLDDAQLCADCSEVNEGRWRNEIMADKSTAINEPLGDYLIVVNRYGPHGGYRGVVELEGRIVYDTGTLLGRGARVRCLVRCREWAGERIDAAEAGAGGGG